MKNTWRVVTANAPVVFISYVVFGNTRFSAQNHLDQNRAFIAPTGMFLYIAGQIQRPVAVTIQLPEKWTRIATGLDRDPRDAHTFRAVDFDTLYDSPLLMGNQETLHSYNVKRIRPVALGPFDYDGENLTNMLWVSEGLSVDYQDLLLVRAGLMTEEQYLDKMKNAITSFENMPGRHYQSATDASVTAWGTSGVGNDRNTTISYYNNGAMLGAMLDLKVRNATSNRRSLDDVMRALYNGFYKEKKRGFTDDEFREVCEAIAGTSLTEVFEYASTTKDVDYARYFAYAGLDVRFTSNDVAGSSIGLNTQLRSGRLIVSGLSAGSPAEAAGLREGDAILEVDGVPATAKALNDMLAAKPPGEKAKLKISRSNMPLEIEATLAKRVNRRYEILPLPTPTALQADIRRDWMRSGQ